MMARRASSTFRQTVALGVLVAASALPAAAVVVDEFTTNQPTLTDPPGGASSVVTGGSDVVGQRRDLVVDFISGSGTVQAGVAGGVLTVTVSDGTPDARGAAIVTWDGDSDPNVLDADGLMPLDLTASGHTAFAVTVTAADAGAEIVLEVYTDDANMSRAALVLPAVVSSTVFHLSYQNDFVPRLGSGADFADVGAIVMTVRGTETEVMIAHVETVAPIVTAVKVDLTLADAPIGATPQPPGTTFKYRVTITNTGGEALAVDLSDTVDANTTLAAATVDATPIAGDDAYETYGNVGKTVAAAEGLLANDVDPDQNGAPPELVVDVSGSPVTTALGGTATLSADGAFVYEPPIGVGNAVDTFPYTVTDNEGNAATATAKVHVGRTIWFVDDAHPGADLGTKDDPFVGFTATNVGGAGGIGDQDAPGDLIFLYDGTHVSGLELEAEQELIGEGHGLVLDGETIVAAGGTPTITNAAGHGIVVASDNAIRGLIVGNTSGVDVTGSTFGTLTVENVTLNGSGGALDLTNGTLVGAGPPPMFNTIISTNSTGRGVNLDTVTGTLTSGSTSVTDSAQAGIRVVNGGSTYDFGPTTLSSTTSGLELTNNATSTFNFTSLAVTTDAGPGLMASNSGTLSIGGAGNTIAATGGAGVDVTSTSFGAGATFSNVSSTGNAGGKGINLDTVTGSFVATGGSISGTGNVAFDVNSGTGAISYAGGITNAANRAVEVTGRTTSTVTLSGNVSDSGMGVNIASNSGGTVTLSGTYSGTAASSQIDVTGNSGAAIVNFSGSSKVLSTGASNAIDVTSNGTAQVNFTGGGLGVTTTSGIGFNATGGAGGITVQGSSNAITSTSGSALNVANTQIGLAGLNFQSISAGTSSGTSGVGISVIGSGLAAGNGGLTISGTGSAGSGGTIQHKTGSDGSTTAGIGIYLQDTKNVDLAWMQLNDFDNSAIAGRNVQGFELTNSVINGVIGTSTAQVEGAIAFGLTNPGGANGLQGTGLIRNTKISGSIEHNMEFYNQSGSMNLTIDGTAAVSEGANPNSPADDVADCIIEENSVAGGSDGILIEMQGTAAATIVIHRCLFRDNKSQAVQIAAIDNSMISARISESRTRRFDQGNEGFILSNGSNADLTAMISNNHVNNYGGTAIFVGQTPGNASASSVLHASIIGNTVNQPTTATNHGILAFLTSTVGQVSQARVRIDSNTVVNNSTAGTVRGILVDTPDASTTPAFHATVTNNSVAVGDNVGGVAGLVVQGRQGADTCANIGSNTVTFPNGTPGGVLGIRARQANTATFDLEGSGLCSGTAAAVLACRNPASTTEVLGTLTVVGAGTCLLPNVP